MTLSQWDLSVLNKYRTDLLKITSLLVADAAFSVLPFVESLKEIGFSLKAVCVPTLVKELFGLTDNAA